jgi:hypothetical protein
MALDTRKLVKTALALRTRDLRRDFGRDYLSCKRSMLPSERKPPTKLLRELRLAGVFNRPPGGDLSVSVGPSVTSARRHEV